MSGGILIYGASGYTGRLIAQEAVRRGAKPILAGRTLANVEAVAKPLGLPTRAFDLRDPKAIAAGLRDVFAFGPDYVLGFEGVTRTDLDR